MSLVSPHSSVAILCQVGQMVCGFAVLKWTRPEDVGAWQLFVILDPYFGVLRLGVVNAMSRSYPFLMGKGDVEQARLCVATTQTYTFVIALLEVLLLGAIICVWSRISSIWLVGGLLYCVYSPLGLIRGTLEATYRSSRDFVSLSRVQLWTLAISILGVFWAARLGFTGYMLRLLAIQLAGTVLIWVYRPIRVPMSFNWGMFKHLTRTGVHLCVNNWLNGISGSFLKVAVVTIGGMTLLGQLAPALGIIGLGVMVPSTLSMYVLPQLNFEFGRTSSLEGVLKNAIKTCLFSAFLSLPILAVGWVALPGLVARMAPNYDITSTTIHLALIVAVASTTKLCANAFSVLGAWKSMYANTAVTLLAFWIGPRLGTRWMSGSPIEGALLGMIAAQIVQMVFIFILIWILYRANQSRTRPRCH